MDTKHKGNLAVASAIQHFVSAGYTVSVPLADTAKYDLVVEHGGQLQRVQCKYAGYEGHPGVFSVPLYVSGGNRSAGNRRLRYQPGDFDTLFVLCANGSRYAIPFEAVAGQTTVNIGRRGRWARWEGYLLPEAGDNCSPAEESAGENSSKSANPSQRG